MGETLSVVHYGSRRTNDLHLVGFLDPAAGQGHQVIRQGRIHLDSGAGVGGSHSGLSLGLRLVSAILKRVPIMAGHSGHNR